jgi:hypothetical protein
LALKLLLKAVKSSRLKTIPANSFNLLVIFYEIAMVYEPIIVVKRSLYSCWNPLDIDAI